MVMRSGATGQKCKVGETIQVPSLSLNHVFRFKTGAWFEKYELTDNEIN